MGQQYVLLFVRLVYIDGKKIERNCCAWVNLSICTVIWNGSQLAFNLKIAFLQNLISVYKV